MIGKRETEHKTVRTGQRSSLDWASIDWTKTKEDVKKWQQEIFRETRASNFRRVKQLQKLLGRSLSARLWAVRLVTEINSGKRTAGPDGVLCKTDSEKISLVENMSLGKYKPFPVKITFIPKPGKNEKRKLGIPTIKDRAMQALIKLCMEPKYEANFEPHSFGFRPGRSAIDAVQHIAQMLIYRKGSTPHPGWVFDADLKNCFDNISHEVILEKLGDSPFKNTVKGWLRAGTISRVGFMRSIKGTPQGGVISPLLANIALDGLERQFRIYSRNGKYQSPADRAGKNKYVALFRYADDFIILAPSKGILEEYVIPKVIKFLASIGLTLNTMKSQIVTISEGFTFLGFEFRRFYRRDGTIKEFTYFPMRKRIDRFAREIKEYVKYRWNFPVQELIGGLNRKIKGFCNYFRWSSAHDSFAYLSHRIWRILWQWAQERHPTRGKKWLKTRYWKRVGNNNWTFTFNQVHLADPIGLTLVNWWKRRTKVRAHSSPFDPAEVSYWNGRSRSTVSYNFP